MAQNDGLVHYTFDHTFVGLGAVTVTLSRNGWICSDAYAGECEARAKELFLRSLSSAQREEWDRHRTLTIPVRGRRSLILYLDGTILKKGIHAGQCNWCVDQAVRYPTYDLLLARKLILENCPQVFFGGPSVAQGQRACNIGSRRASPSYLYLEKDARNGDCRPRCTALRGAATALA